jgi:histidinol phosphatase-like PHP family hydrolase
MRRASRRALTWPVEARDLLAEGAQLTALSGVGDWLAGVIAGWMAAGAECPAAAEIRSGFLTRTQVEQVLARNPQWPGRIRADLQMHTLTTDGHATLETMARGCVALGYSHIAVTDHSQGLRIANGMDAATLERQAAEVRALNAQLSAEGLQLRVLHGLEMNVSPEGDGDTDPSLLAGLDIVLGAFHSKLRLKDDQTDRYIRALRNPSIDVLAHPRGRVYDHRIGLDARWDLVFEAAAESGVAVEVDCYIDRQDLDVELLRLASRYDVWVAVDTDAHHPIDLRSMRFGVATLALAEVDPARVLNTLEADALLEWVGRRRAGRPGSPLP